MKKTLILALLITCGSFGLKAQQDKSKRASPPAKVSETIASGATVSIDYSQPSLKGRSVGKEVAPYGKVWRTGANEATVFEVNKDVTIEGKPLKAGKYGLYSIPGENEWSIIFNKVSDQWGTQYSEANDALRVSVKPTKSGTTTEKMTFNIAKSGTVSLLWGNTKVDFKVK
jgi:hypothetical protein